jgi:type I restriction enzyme S subunit
VERVELPLPSLQEQRRIVALLDKADSIRAKHREVVDHLDALTQSIFHDMFGDPTKASHSVPLAQVADLVGGRNLVADDQTAQSKYRVLKISSVTRGVFDPLESKALPLDYNPPEKHFVQRGDLLMSRANTAELVGATALVDIDVHRLVLPDKIWRFEWHDPESSPVFYQALLQTPEIRSIISRLSSGTGGSMKNISKQKLARIELPDISIDKQHEFSESVSRVRETGRVMMESGDELNALFTSLQSRAFKGEL